MFRDGYLAGGTGQFGIDLSHPRFHTYLLALGARRLRTIERATKLHAGRLVDVGCGTGELVQAAAQRGWDAYGAEPLEDAAALARERSGRDVRAATLEESGFDERSFDVVAAFHVLEHMPDAVAFLRTLARWARPGGFVVVESPNWDSVLRERSGEQWIHLRPLEHLVHIAPRHWHGHSSAPGWRPSRSSTPSHLDRTQTLREAADALALSKRAHRALARIAPRRDYDRIRAPAAAGAAWPLLRALELAYERRQAGMVVQGIARLPAR